jgi:hypothetical protein
LITSKGVVKKAAVDPAMPPIASCEKKNKIVRNANEVSRLETELSSNRVPRLKVTYCLYGA